MSNLEPKTSRRKKSDKQQDRINKHGHYTKRHVRLLETRLLETNSKRVTQPTQNIKH